MNRLIVFFLIISVQPTWGQGERIHVRWNQGALVCPETYEEPLQVHEYAPLTFIQRQNPCVNFEANFIYLLIGSPKALLIDIGHGVGFDSAGNVYTIGTLQGEKQISSQKLVVQH